MDFKKRFNHEDISIFLPDNITIGTSEFFQKKIPNLPDQCYEILEVKSKEHYTEEDVKQVIEKVKKEVQEGYNKIMQEFKIREEEDIIVIEDFEKKITLLSDDKVEEDE